MELILASQSPRRRELLGLLNIPFTVRAADIDETMDPQADPYNEVARVSRAKALAIPRTAGAVVVAADTIVVVDGQVLGKPQDAADAMRMLQLLSGRVHQVMTGLCVLRDAQCVSCTEVTNIWFRPLTQAEILDYIRTGEPMDKAGSYGIQGRAAPFVPRIEGDYFNVVGLPLCRLETLLKEIAPDLMEERQ